MRAIRRIDIVRKDKKIWLKCPYPADYAEHVMYLFKNDYIRVVAIDGTEQEGYYQNVADAAGHKISVIPANRVEKRAPRITISKTKTKEIHKYDIDILGRKGGEIRCGAPLSLLPEKN